MYLRRLKLNISNGQRGTSAFLILSAFFFFGILLGAISANFVSVDNAKILKELLTNSTSLFYTNRGLGSVLLSVMSFNILSIAFGFAIFGFVLLPPLSGVKGFFLSFSTAAVIRALGKGGVVTALAHFGLPTLISLPCFFILSLQSYKASFDLSSKVLMGRSAGVIYDRSYFLRCSICLAALVFSAFIETYITPFITIASAGL